MEVPYIQFYLNNVLNDRRLQENKAGFSLEADPTNKPQVQAYALKTWTEAKGSFSVNKKTVWLMEFVTTDDFARYCLVPEDSMSLEERLHSALAHLNASVTPLNMLNFHRPCAEYEPDSAEAVKESLNPKYVAFKDWYKERLENLIEWNNGEMSRVRQRLIG